MNFPFRAVTFDCFGTLIDWQKGQRTALANLRSLEPFTESIQEIIQARGPFEIELEKGPWLPYREILALSISQACQKVCAIALPQADAEIFADSQSAWPTFPDTVHALNRLSELTSIGLLSNCDQKVLEQTAKSKLQAPVSLFVSSEATQTYKPNPKHWQVALQKLQCEPKEVLHVSFTPHYDLNTAHELGFNLGFLSRYQTPVPEGLPIKWQASDLSELVQLLAEA